MLAPGKLRELAPRIVLTAIAANFSLYFLQQTIDLHNALCSGIQHVLATAGVGDLNFPGHGRCPDGPSL